MAIIARRDGGLIPSVLASISTKKLIAADLQQKGVAPLNCWISSEELLNEFAKRDLDIWWKPTDADPWKSFDFYEYKNRFHAH